MASPQQIKTTITDLLKIKHPVMLAGMNVAAGPKLAAAVTNAGGLGVIGGVSTPVNIRSFLVHPQMASQDVSTVSEQKQQALTTATGRLLSRYAPRAGR